MELKNYSMSSVTAGIDALAQTKVVISPVFNSLTGKLTAQGRTYERTFTGLTLTGRLLASPKVSPCARTRAVDGRGSNEGGCISHTPGPHQPIDDGGFASRSSCR